MELSAVLTSDPEGGYVAFNLETGTTTQGETARRMGRGASFRAETHHNGARGVM